MKATTTERQRPVLSRDVIAEAALAMTLARPLQPLTLARLGAELGADPTAIYRHFRSRNELLLDLLDRMHAEALAAAATSDDWQESLMAMATATWDVMMRRPALTMEVGVHFTGGPNEQAAGNRVIEILERSGFSPESALLHARIFGALVAAAIVSSATALTTADEYAGDARFGSQLWGTDPDVGFLEYEASIYSMMLRTHLLGLTQLLATELHDLDPGGTP